jgi:predicted dinucleotide-binding enzyme
MLAVSLVTVPSALPPGQPMHARFQIHRRLQTHPAEHADPLYDRESPIRGREIPAPGARRGTPSDRGAIGPGRKRSMTQNHDTDRTRRTFLQFAGASFGAFALGARPDLARAQATSPPLKIGSIGAGRMGGALGELFVKAGHPVMFSSRHPDKIKPLAARLGPLAQVGTVEQAVAFGDVIVLVVPYAAIEEIGKAHGRAIASKALLLDICNPIARRDGEAVVTWANEQGGAGLATAKLLPGAKIVRAFNGISYRRVVDIAHRAGTPVGVPIAGDDQKAIALAEGIIRGMGFEPVLIGGLAMGKYLLPGMPLAGEHSPAELRQIAATLR